MNINLDQCYLKEKQPLKISIHFEDQPEKGQKFYVAPQTESQNKANQAKYRNGVKKAKSKNPKKKKKKKAYQKIQEYQKSCTLNINSNVKSFARVGKNQKDLTHITYFSFNQKSYCLKEYTEYKTKNKLQS